MASSLIDLRRLASVLVAALALTACAPTPTPLPAFIPPTATVPPISPTPSPLRYALILTEIVTIGRFASDLWITRNRKWRK